MAAASAAADVGDLRVGEALTLGKFIVVGDRCVGAGTVGEFDRVGKLMPSTDCVIACRHELAIARRGPGKCGRRLPTRSLFRPVTGAERADDTGDGDRDRFSNSVVP